MTGFMKRAKVGDRLRFKKFDWVITDIKRSKAGVPYYKYGVRRRYFFNNSIPLKYTDQTYDIFPWRWEFCKKMLRENPDWHYTMNLWSGHPRR